MLEEVEMAPGLLDRVMDGATVGLALGTDKAAAGREVELDVEALASRVERTGGDEPRRGDAEGQLKEIVVAHAGTSGVGTVGDRSSAPVCRRADRPSRTSPRRARKGASLTAVRPVDKRPAMRIKPHSGRSSGPHPPTQFVEEPYFPQYVAVQAFISGLPMPCSCASMPRSISSLDGNPHCGARKDCLKLLYLLR
jgi:hypothetical protein